MDDSLSTIAALTKRGYRLTLYRSASGKCWADLQRGWLLKGRIRVDLDRDRFEHAKQILGAALPRDAACETHGWLDSGTPRLAGALVMPTPATWKSAR